MGKKGTEDWSPPLCYTEALFAVCGKKGAFKAFKTLDFLPKCSGHSMLSRGLCICFYVQHHDWGSSRPTEDHKLCWVADGPPHNMLVPGGAHESLPDEEWG